MKKLLIILICALIVLTVAVAGLAFMFMANTRTTTTEVAAEIAEIPWYEITQDEQGGSVLTVRLPITENIARWDYEISDEALLELLTHETTGEYTASFRSFAQTPNPTPVTLTLTAYNSSNTPTETRTLHLTVTENNTLSIN